MKEYKRRLSLAPGKISRLIRKGTGKRAGIRTGIFMAAVIEYLAQETLDASVRGLKKNQKTITAGTISRAIRDDADLKEFYPAHSIVEERRTKKKKKNDVNQDAA